MAYTIDVFGSTYAGWSALPQYDGEQPWGAGCIPGTLVGLPGGGAWDALGASATLPGSERITIKGEWVAASASAMQTKMDTLRALVGTRSKLWSSPDGGTTTRWRTARCLEVRSKMTPGAVNWATIELDFDLVAGPWNGAAHDETTVLDSETHSVVTTNGGNATVRDAIITVTAKVATITRLVVQDGAAPVKSWVYDGVIAVNKKLMVFCGSKRIWNENTGDDYAHFALQSAHASADWLPIAPGVNEWSIGTTSDSHTTHEFKVTYNDGWM